jgi:hypothetical protein
LPNSKRFCWELDRTREVKKSRGEEVEIKVAADGKLVGVGKEEEDDDQEAEEDQGYR